MSIEPEPPELPEPSATEAVAADQTVAQATGPGARPAGHEIPPHTHCQNCGTELRGRYCHVCGQHDFEFHRSFSHVLLDALENFFHFDEKLFHSVVTLLFRPGRLTAAFNTGRRISQVPPFRLYVFVSVLFFFVRYLDAPAAGNDIHLTPVVTSPAASSAAVTKKDAAPAAGQPQRDAPPESAGPEKQTEAGGFEHSLGEKGRQALEHQHALKEAFVHALPKMMLFCLPFFALYTRVLFRRTGYVYLQHLVVALHYHTFVYLWWMVGHGWSALFGLGSPGLGTLVRLAAMLWMLLYPLLMLRRLFGQSWLRTLVKTVLLAGVYVFTLGCGFLITAVVVLLLL